MLTRVRHEASAFLSPILSLSSAEIERFMEVPKKPEHGHLAYPVFSLAKTLRKAPPIIATEFAAQIASLMGNLPQLQAVTAVGGYLNFTFATDYLQKVLLLAVQNDGERLGYSDVGLGKTVVIDYSSPNVAKPMHVGHLRSNVIGQAVRNMCVTQGYKVIGLNHLGDWGVQFGKLAWAYREWGQDYDFESRPFQSLFDMYVRFHAEAEKNPELETKGSLVFKQLEEGDPELEKIWQKFVAISLVEYQRLWDVLGVKHDLVRGESFYNDRLKDVEKMLEEKNLLVESQGAMVVNLGDEMPPCLIRKSDGASLYATRDLASAIYRHYELEADLILYVVGSEQTLHFRQVFKVLDLMGYSWWNTCDHVGFGMYRFKEGQMSTRKGRVVFLEDVLDKAISMVDKVIEAKNPTLVNRELISRQVGVGAIIFNDLVNDRVKNVEFDWDRVLNFEGDSGPYLQYCHVRCVSLLQKHGKALSQNFNQELGEPEERELLRTLLNYQDVLTAAAAVYKPNILAQYLLDVTAAFNHFYNKHRVIGTPQESDRMLLVYMTQTILKMGLKVLNIQAPQAM